MFLCCVQVQITLILFLSGWSGHESLITFDFIGRKTPESDMNSENLCDDIVNHTPCEHGEGDYDESTSDHDDSGYFCDSDSGISSLYEAIRRQCDPQQFREHENVTDESVNTNVSVYQHKQTSCNGVNCTEKLLNMLSIDVGFLHLCIRQQIYCS